MSKTSQRKVSAFSRGREDFKRSWFILIEKTRDMCPMPKNNGLSVVWYAGFLAAQNGQQSNKLKKAIMRRKMALAGR